MANYIRNVLNQKINLDGRVPTRAKDSIAIPPEAFEPRNDTVLYWLGGGGFLLNSRSTIILIDPVVEKIPGSDMMCETNQKLLMDFPIKAEDLLRADMVLYTHADEDHVGPLTAPILSRKGFPMMAPYPVAWKLLSFGCEMKNISICRPEEKYDVGCVHIDTFPTDHPWQVTDIATFGQPYRYGDTCGYVVRTPDGSFMFPGDSRLMEQHFCIPDIDVLMVDTCGCIFHMNREGAIILANHYRNSYVIPYHYGLIDDPTGPAHEKGDPELVFDAVYDADKRGFVLAPGEPFVMSERKHIPASAD